MPGGEPLLIELSWPAKELNPNNHPHHMALYRFKKAAKTEAHWATRIVRPFSWGADGPFDVLIRAYPPVQRDRDKDNLVASCKAYLDGIADALGVNDKMFNAPSVDWCDTTKNGKLVIRISEAA